MSVTTLSNRTYTNTATRRFAAFEGAILVGPMDRGNSLLTFFADWLADQGKTTTGRPSRQSRQRMVKVALDLLVILMALPTLLLVFGLCALLVKLASSGPLFTRRSVLGLDGERFDLLSFRTDTVDGERGLTWAGSLLQKYCLNELPQLLNVLQGQMSLVGPRVMSPAEGELIREYRDELLSVAPGLTGLWQVSGGADLGFNERVLLDMQYVRQYSVRLDIDILFRRTVMAVVGRGNKN